MPLTQIDPATFTPPPGPEATGSPSSLDNGTRILRNAEGDRAEHSFPAADPPDPTGAIGPTQYIQITNSRIDIYNRLLTNRLATRPLHEFVNPDPGRLNILLAGDPQVIYDPQTQRWFYAAHAVAGRRNEDFSFLVFGWSKTANPADLLGGRGQPDGAWCKWRTNRIGTEFPDFPKLGDNDVHIIIGTDQLQDAASDLYVGSRIWAIPKPPPGTIRRCQRWRAKHTGLLQPSNPPPDIRYWLTPVAANTVRANNNGYVIGRDFGANPPRFRTWRVSGPRRTPTIQRTADILVPAWDAPPWAPQIGTSCLLNSLDGRLTQAVANFDIGSSATRVAVWTQHTIKGTGGRSVVRWYQLMPGDPSPLRQQGTLADGQHWLLNPAISPTVRTGSTAAITYNASSSSIVPAILVRTRRASTPPGQMGDQATIHQGSSSDNTCEPPDLEVRWGDYPGASPDPRRQLWIWGTNEYAGPPRAPEPPWRTRNFAVCAFQSGDPNQRCVS